MFHDIILVLNIKKYFIRKLNVLSWVYIIYPGK